LDSTFGSGGVATASPASPGTSASLNDIALQPDGKVVAVGYAAPNGISLEVAVVRFTATGSPDGTFGTGGIVRTPVGANAVAYAVALQPDGQIVIGGWRSDANTEALLVRYSGANGSLDASFGAGGISTPNIGQNNEARTLLVQPDGKIVAAGADALDFVLTRYSSGGVLDSSFGSNGVVRTSIGASGSDVAYDLVTPFPGSLLAVGTTDQGAQIFALARYSATTPITLEEFSVE
jgi:uncharacterized delta-60 repeat protein